MVLLPIRGIVSPFATGSFSISMIMGRRIWMETKTLESFDHLTFGRSSLSVTVFWLVGPRSLKLVLWGFTISDKVPGTRLFLAFVVLLGLTWRFAGFRGK